MQRSYRQNQLNYESEEYNSFTITEDEKQNIHENALYGKSYAFSRRKSLFNLYAFTYTDSY